LGTVSFKRQRYRCHNCGEEYYPLDEQLEICRSRASKRLAKAITQVGIFIPFEDVRKLLKELLLIPLSVTFIEQVAVRVGNAIFKDSEKKSQRPYAIEKREEDVDTLYIEADGSMVPLVGEGCVEYKENKLGIVFNNKDIIWQISKKGKESTEIIRKKLISSLAQGVEPFKKMLYAGAIEKGYFKAKTVIFLSDGAAWLSKLKDEFFPKAIKILDWYHAVEHLWTTARALFGENDDVKCRSWVSPLEGLLWEGKVDNVIRLIDKEIFSRKQNQKPLIELRGYYNSNREGMKYNEYRKNGWFIGSGPIESANKYIVNQRLKQSGMKWIRTRANAIIWACCKYYENEWDEFWDQIKLADYLNEVPTEDKLAA
jgi:hypothetical protein